MFHSTRLKLTAWYLLIIMGISLTFSAAMYRVLVSEVERFARVQRFSIERRLGIVPTNPELLVEVRERILWRLILVNVGIFILSGGLGYVLAGRTLRPIGDMVDEQNRFISDASHELKTPLTSLKSAFEVYLRNRRRTLKEADAVMRESIEEVDKLHSLSESMLQLAQYQKPVTQSRFESVNLDEVVRSAIRKIRPIAKKRGVRIFSKTEHIKVAGSKYNLEDLFVIFLDNAVKYSHPHGKVAITIKRIDGYGLVSVKDEGVGIDKKDMSHIFDRFFRADEARSKTGSDGYGLGLAIAKKIVHAHKGFIQVESFLGKGTMFTVRLPLQLVFS